MLPNLWGGETRDPASVYREGKRWLEDHPEDQSVRSLVLAAIEGTDLEGGAYYFSLASQDLQNDRSFVLEAVRLARKATILEVVAERFQNDREVVLAAVQSKGRELEYASERLQNDREVVLDAIDEDPMAFSFASSALQNDREIVMRVISDDRLHPYYGSEYEVLAHVSEELRNDREVVLAAVRRNGFELDNASEELKDNDEVVAEAVFAARDVRANAGDVFHLASEAQRRKYETWERDYVKEWEEMYKGTEYEEESISKKEVYDHFWEMYKQSVS